MTNTILDLINRVPEPAPWSEGDNIPWDDPEFSERMLVEHLNQDHDLASRKSDSIENQVEWIFSEILGGRSAKILDLACGPGLYASRFAKKGCVCVGIDFSPASIRHAKAMADEKALSCTYHHLDVRDGQFGEGFDLVMMIYGQLNVFTRDRGLEILRNAHKALRTGGRVLLEIQTKEQIQKAGLTPATWYTSEAGLFSPQPHVVLQENFWDDRAHTSTNRFSVIDGHTGKVSSYSLSNEAYSEQDLTNAVESIGFSDATWFPSLTGSTVSKEQDLLVLVARK